MKQAENMTERIVVHEGVEYYARPWPRHKGFYKLVRVVQLAPKAKNPIKASKEGK